MHALIGAVAYAVTSTPSPTPIEPDPVLVTPGPWGFVAIAFVALVVVLLVWDMLRRIRRGRYRSEVREQLDAEELAAAQAHRGLIASAVDDQDVDRDDAADGAADVAGGEPRHPTP